MQTAPFAIQTTLYAVQMTLYSVSVTKHAVVFWWKAVVLPLYAMQFSLRWSYFPAFSGIISGNYRIWHSMFKRSINGSVHIFWGAECWKGISLVLCLVHTTIYMVYTALYNTMRSVFLWLWYFPAFCETISEKFRV